jgi:hypothetical protein
MVRAKFTVLEITRRKWYASDKKELYTIKMSPVVGTDNNEENKKFFSSTPSGTIELGLLYEETANLFELGKSYYVDFTPAE